MPKPKERVVCIPPKIDLTGQKFGRLTVLYESEKLSNGRRMWVCSCDCGTTTNPVDGNSLRQGRSKSCGCLRKEAVRKTGKANKTHGMSTTKIHGVWAGMKARCDNPNTKYFAEYGGRGIRVCELWHDDFLEFYGYVSRLPHYGEPGYSLDRIDNNGNYEPGNVRWATAKEQQNNKREYRPRAKA